MVHLTYVYACRLNCLSFLSLVSDRNPYLVNDSLVLFAASKGPIGLDIHQVVKLLGTLLVNLDLDDPAAAGAVVLGDLVDGGGLLLEVLVDLDYEQFDRGVDVAG